MSDQQNNVAVTIDLAEVPCTVPRPAPLEIGVRLKNILSRIDFPDREKISLTLTTYGMSHYLTLSTRVDCTTSQAPIQLSHNIPLPYDVTDDQLARAVLRIVGQFVIHEFFECFRFDGQILANPHESGRNETLFTAVDKAAEPVKSLFQFVTVEVTLPTIPPTAKPVPLPSEKESTFEDNSKESAKPKRGTERFAKFMPKAWQNERKRAA